MPIGQKKAPTSNQYSGTAKPAYFGFGEALEIKGYWLHPTQHLSVEVAIFDHGYYPKIDATNTEIDQNIRWRKVTLPSLQELRAEGIAIDAAIAVSEINVPPRHIKNWNFFRSDFPAMIKQVARQNNFAVIFPASDMPSARIERKKVLNLYRTMFSPLLINRRQYTSGRMNFFFTAPKDATKGFRQGFNLEEGWGRNKRTTNITIKRNDPADKIAQAIAREMKKDIMPVISQQLEVKSGSPVYDGIEDYLGSPDTAKELMSATNNGKSPNKIRKWVKTKMVPYIKEVAAQEGMVLADRLFRFTLQVTLSVILGHILGRSKKAMPRLFKNVTINGGSGVNFDIGGVNMRHSRKDATSVLKRAKEYVFHYLQEGHYYGYGVQLPFDEFIDVTISNGVVFAKINRVKLKELQKYDEKSVEAGLGNERFMQSLERYDLPRAVKKTNTAIKSGENFGTDDINLTLNGF